MNEQTQIQKRINRIKGQVEGVQRMVDEGRHCMDIVQQIAAIRSALAKVGVEILKDETLSCSKENNIDDLEKVLDSLFKLT